MAEPEAETLGPVEYVVIGFRGGRPDGVAPALRALVEEGLIRIIDLAVVSRDADARATILEVQELSPEAAALFEKLTGAVSGLLSEADLEAIAADLEPDSGALAVLVEHVWATRFATAVRAAGGELVLSERIPAAVIAEARASLRAAAG